MGAYLLRRLLIAVPTLFGLSVVSFTIISLAPGDAASALISPEEAGAGSAEAQAEMRSRLGLDDPLPVRYWHWMSNVLQGDLGRSLIDHRSITTILRDSASLTLQLTVPALIIGLAVAIVVGLWTGSRPYTGLDNAISILSITVAGLPGFVVGLLLLYLFAVRFHLLPAGGHKDIGVASVSLLDRWQYFVLPVLTLSAIEAAHLVRYVRDSVINVRSADYVQTARAKGLPEKIVLGQHVLRNALLPIITLAALQIPGLISGALLVEIVFGWGGIGSRVAVAVGQRDFPVIMGATMLIGVIVVIANLLADIFYAIADPRIRLT
jgi:peptide/nickel transport system permease protein